LVPRKNNAQCTNSKPSYANCKREHKNASASCHRPLPLQTADAERFRQYAIQ
jgi:hypothetical protein